MLRRESEGNNIVVMRISSREMSILRGVCVGGKVVEEGGSIGNSGLDDVGCKRWFGFAGIISQQ